MLKYTIKFDESGQRLDKLLSKKFPNLPMSLLYKYIRKKRVKINGKRAVGHQMLLEKDVLELYINDEFLVTKPADNSFRNTRGALEILFENNHILVVYKPKEVSVHDGRDSMRNRLLYYLFHKGQYSPNSDTAFIPAFCNRLDTNTEGLLLAGKTALGVRELNSLLREKKIQKTYLCLVKGQFVLREKVYRAFLKKGDNNAVIVKSEPFSESKEILTEISKREQYKHFSLLEITLHTGRTHQIRAHLGFLGYPVVGDNKYGDISLNQQLNCFTQCLLSHSLTFSFEEEEHPALADINHKTFTTSHTGEFFSQVKKIVRSQNN